MLQNGIKAIFNEKRLAMINAIYLNNLKHKTINIYQLKKEVNMSPAHVFNIVNIFEAYGLLVKKKEGREMLLELTDKGKALAQASNYILKKFTEHG